MKMMLSLKLLMLFAALFYGCSQSEEIILIGNLGDFESRIVLSQSGDKYAGYFQYVDPKAGKSKIEVEGVLSGTLLRLEEFNNEENKLTGIFEGQFDGEDYSGYWKDPLKSGNVSFQYSLSRKIVEEKIHERKTTIKYFTFDKFDGPELYNGLKAMIGEKVYVVIDRQETDIKCMSRVVTEDFNNDGYNEALVQYAPACGGNCCGNQLFFVVYDEKADEFFITEGLGYTWTDPIIEDWNGVKSVKVIESTTGMEMTEMSESTERYVLKGKEVELVESIETKAIPAVREIKSSQFDWEANPGEKILEFDLDQDGENDQIVVEYWSRWGSLFWEVNFSNGKSYDADIACKRIGVLNSSTNGVNDLVCEFDSILKWDGKKYKMIE